VLNAFVDSLFREGSLSGHWTQEQEKSGQNLNTYALKKKFKSKSAYQLWSEDDSLLLRSENEPTFSVHGFSRVNIDEQLWPIFDDLLKANALGHKYERKSSFSVVDQERRFGFAF